VRFAGGEWLREQTVAAYVAIMSLTLGLFFSLRGKLRPVGYLLLAPLLFIFALVAAALFSPASIQYCISRSNGAGSGDDRRRHKSAATFAVAIDGRKPLSETRRS